MTRPRPDLVSGNPPQPPLEPASTEHPASGERPSHDYDEILMPRLRRCHAYGWDPHPIWFVKLLRAHTDLDFPAASALVNDFLARHPPDAEALRKLRRRRGVFWGAGFLAGFDTLFIAWFLSGPLSIWVAEQSEEGNGRWASIVARLVSVVILGGLFIWALVRVLRSGPSPSSH